MVFSSGQVLTAAGINGVTLNNIATYTPTVAGGGTVTWTTRTGWYFKIGTSKLVCMCAYLVVNAAGSGGSFVTVTAPTSLDRTTRQLVPADIDGPGGGTAGNDGHARAFTTGSGAVFDRVSYTGLGGMTGADLSSAAIITILGWYREA